MIAFSSQHGFEFFQKITTNMIFSDYSPYCWPEPFGSFWRLTKYQLWGWFSRGLADLEASGKSSRWNDLGRWPTLSHFWQPLQSSFWLPRPKCPSWLRITSRRLRFGWLRVFMWVFQFERKLQLWGGVFWFRYWRSCPWDLRNRNQIRHRLSGNFLHSFYLPGVFKYFSFKSFNFISLFVPFAGVFWDGLGC